MDTIVTTITYCDNPYSTHTKKDKKGNLYDIWVEAETTRPSENHMTGSAAAQQLCEPCATAYDNSIRARQAEARNKRLEDLKKKQERKERH